MSNYEFLPLLGQSDPQLGVDEGQESTINWFPLPSKSKTPTNYMSVISPKPLMLYPTEGSVLAFSNSGVQVRGAIEAFGNGYYVVGGTVYLLNTSTNTSTSIGTLNTTSGRVAMAYISNLVMFVDGTNGYIYNIGTATFVQISSGSFPNGTMDVCSMDGYFICPNPNSQNFQISTDGLTWNSLLTGVSDTQGDNIVAIRNWVDQLYVIGTSYTQIFYDSVTQAASNLFPFIPQIGAVFNFGAQSPATVVSCSNYLCMLSTTKRGELIPISVQGSTVSPIFTRGTIERINSFATTSDAYAFCYTKGMQEFYVLTFPSAGHTFVWDLTSGLEHERSSFNVSTQSDQAWFPYCYMNLNGVPYVGDYSSGNLFTLSDSAFTENGNRIRRQRRSMIFSEDRNYRTFYELFLRCETNQAVGIGQGSAPQMMLRTSTDGGHTFSAEMWATPGTSGQFYDQLVWYGLGAGRKWCFEITVTDPILWKLYEVFAVVEASTND